MAPLGFLVGWIGLSTGAEASPPDPSRESVSPHRKALSGDWGGFRTQLKDWGLSFELLYTFDGVWVAAGGRSTGWDALGNLDLVLEVDLQALAGWEGATLTAYGLWAHGGLPTDRVGDIQTIDNIESPNGARLFELHLRLRLFRDRLDVLVGLYDVNSEFDVIPAAAFFVHSSFGMGADVGTSGLNGPSTFPTTSLAARVEIRPEPFVFLRALVADGVPGVESRPGGTGVRLRGGDGILWMAEAGFIRLPAPEARRRVDRRFAEALDSGDFGNYGKYAVGAWGYTTDFMRDGTQDERPSMGGYLLIQQSLFNERQNPLRGLVGFLRFGGTTSVGHAVQAYLGGGLVYEGLLGWDHTDRVGLAFAAALPARGASGPDGPALSEDWEVAIEFSYRMPLLHWLSLQPDLQFVSNPAGPGGGRDAFVVALRSLVIL